MPEENIITLIDDEGDQVRFTLVEMLELDEGVYACLVPLDIADGDEAVLLRVEKDDEGEILVAIEDDEEYEKATNAFEEFWSEEN